jgi:acetyl esterase/lipase
MRSDIAAFAAKVAAQGVPCTYNEEPREPHAYAMLAMPHLMQKGLVVPNYLAGVALAAAGTAT